MRPGTVAHARAWRERTGADCADVDAYAAAYAQACLAERAETVDDLVPIPSPAYACPPPAGTSCVRCGSRGPCDCETADACPRRTP